MDGLYATEYHYDDPRFVATMQWFQDMIAGGFFAPYEDVASLGNNSLFAAGGSAMADLMELFEAMADAGVRLLVHAESTDPAVDIFDREAVFLEREQDAMCREVRG